MSFAMGGAYLQGPQRPTASADGLLMGLRHRQRPMVGVQLHPESVLTPEGPTRVRNFLEGRY